MKKDLTVGLFHRKDGRYQRKEMIGGVWKTFSANTPAEVWEKVEDAKEEQEEKERIEEERSNAGPLFSEIAKEYIRVVQGMKSGTQKSYLPAVKRATDEFGEYHMREIEPYMIAEFLRGPEMAGRAATTVSNQKTVINNIFQYWIDSPKWRGDVNPATQTKMPRGLHKGKRQPPTNEQVAVVKEHYLDPDALPAVAYLCTGERKGEMCAIQLRDIDFDKTSSTSQNYRAQGQCRCDKGLWQTPAAIRQVPLLSMLKEALQPIRKMPKTHTLLALIQSL